MIVGICDDELAMRAKIYGICTDIFNKYGEEIRIIMFTDGAKICETGIDILILDVDIPVMNGIEVKQRLQKNESETLIIFVTNHDEYMPQAFGKNVIGFVSKSKLEERFAESLEEAIRIKSRNKIIEGINSKNILYIQAAQEYCMLMLKDGSHKLVRDSIKEIEKKLSGTSMVKIHKSYIVNFAYVECIQDRAAIIGKIHLPISVRNMAAVCERYKKFCFNSAVYF